AVTVQNTLGVDRVVPLEADLVTAQIEAVASDFTVRATKVGMLATAAIVEAVAAPVDPLELAPVVVHPRVVASGGERPRHEDGVRALTAELLRRARLVTPNAREAEVLSGRRIDSRDGARDAARAIRDLGPRAVLITGGHARWAGDDDVVDLLLDGEAWHELRVPRVETVATPRTG